MRTPLFRGMKLNRWGAAISLLLLSSLFLAACGENSPSILNTVGPVAGEEAGLFWFILIVATIVFVFVEGWLIFSIVRYRARPNTPEPRQSHGNNTAELIWTIVPSIFLFAVLIGTIYTMFSLQNVSGSSKITVNVVAHQWWWEFDYPNNGGIVTADTLYIPKGAVVETNLYSNNVIHSFWIPQITGKTDDIPGHTNTKIFRADTAGVYEGLCTEFCGAQHAHMDFNVVVFNTMDEFNTWASQQQQAAQTPTDTLALQGMNIFKGAGGCTACHGIVGVNLSGYNDPKATGLVGPNLTHFGSRSLIAGGVLTNNAGNIDPNTGVLDHSVNNQCQPGNLSNCNLAKWLANPQAVKPGNDMFVNLTPDQINALVAYLESLQ